MTTQNKLKAIQKKLNKIAKAMDTATVEEYNKLVLQFQSLEAMQEQLLYD